jgi:hypothetical protein
MSNLAKAVAFLEQGDWESAHHIVQEDASTLGAWAHGIVHMLEGDISNAGYWYRKAGRSLPDASAINAEIAELKAQTG